MKSITTLNNFKNFKNFKIAFNKFFAFLFLISLVISNLSFALPTLIGGPELPLHPIDKLRPCSDFVINTIYIPKLKEYADWTNEQLYPVAKNVCLLEVERNRLQKSISDQAKTLRENNWRVCGDLVPGGNSGITPACVQAHAEKINSLIDHCREVVRLGHNPHNVGILVDDLNVEIACLKGIDAALK